jgi:O-antigen/teichoic acid export membrane protein
MGIIANQSIKSSLVIYLGILIGAFNVLWLYPKFFSLEQIGLLRVLQDLPFILALFFRLGASNISDRFFGHFRDPNAKHNGFLFMILSYPILGVLLFLGLFFAFNDYWKSFFVESPLMLEYFYLLPFLMLFLMYFDILESYLRANFLTVYPNIMREVVLRLLFTGMVIAFILHWFDFKGVMYFFTFSYGFVLLLSFWYTQRQGLLHLQPNFRFVQKDLYKDMGYYLMYIIPGSAGAIIAQKIDTLMIGSMKDLKAVGIYSIAYFIGSVVEVPRRSITAISMPLLAKGLKENDLSYVDQLYKKNSLTQLLAGAIIFTLIWVNIDELLSLIPNSEKYSEGKYVILYIGLAKLVIMLNSINGEIIQISKYFRFNIVALIFLAFVTVSTNLYFIEKYAILGAAMAFLITIVLFNLLKTIYLYRQMKIHPFSYKMIHIGITTGLLLLVSSLCSITPTGIFMAITTIGIKSLVTGITFFFLIRYFKVSEEVNQVIDQIAQKYKIKLPF